MSKSKEETAQPLAPEDQPHPHSMPTEGDEVRDIGKRAADDDQSAKQADEAKRNHRRLQRLRSGRLPRLPGEAGFRSGTYPYRQGFSPPQLREGCWSRSPNPNSRCG